MSNSDIEYENDLADQLGWNEANAAQYEVPITILKYHKTIEDNDRVSIFDTDVYNNVPTNDNCGSTRISDIDAHLPDNGNEIRVISGRGRGGRSIYQKPGVTATQEYEDVTRYLRKVAPLGYGNEITENALRRNRALKKENKENIQTFNDKSSKFNKSKHQNATATTVTASTTSSSSSEYFDTKEDANNSNSNSTVSPELFKDINTENITSTKEPTKTTAVPLSELLRKTREQYRTMRLQKLKNSEENGNVKPVKPPDGL